MSKEVAFLVNGQPVRVNYFTQMINWYKLNSGITELVGSEKEAFKEFVKDEVIGIYVTQQYCDDLRITLSAADRQMIEEKINVFAQNYGGLEAFQSVLESAGITYDVYYSLQEYYALRSKLLDVMTDQVSEDTLRWYYEDHIEDYQTEQVLVKHILLRTTDDNDYPLSDSIKQEKKRDMELILDEIQSGEKTFDEAMNEYSEDPGLATNPDGYWVAPGAFTKAFENVAFSLQPGEMSDIFESEDGYHILMVLDKKIVDTPFENVKDNIYNTIRNDRYFIVMNPKIESADIILNTNVYNSI